MVGRRPVHALLALVFVLVGCGSWGGGPGDDLDEGPSRGTLVVETEDGEVRISVEIAVSLEDRLRGLKYRRSLPPDAGMVFLEDAPTTSGFVMEDTLIPLSIAFWGEDRHIFRILDMEPCRAEPCPVYEPHGEWVGAVEVNRGFFGRHGVRAGDTVRLVRP